ncbi:DUF4226 domain-containing protein [Mycolicibacter minnesotensis]
MPEELGAHADAARTREATLERWLQGSARADGIFEETVRGAAKQAALGRARLDSIEAEIGDALNKQTALSLDTPAGARQFQLFLTAKTREILRVLDDTAADSRARADALRSVRGGYSLDNRRKPGVQGVDFITPFKQAPAPVSDEERKRNQRAAFRRVMGRDPVSDSDWTTAAALDTETYNPEFQGTKAEIKVFPIDRVPGQGVVRTSQWIEQPWVVGAGSLNAGNGRGPNQDFDPEDTKVTTYIDYDNGIVVVRQNPSVVRNLDGSLGESKVGVPECSVAQAADGSVRVKYDAANPLAPAPLTKRGPPLFDHRLSVNGDLVFTPGPGGVRVDGTRTDYPSLEVYQDLPGGSTRTVLIDPAQSGRSLGPLLNLGFHHEIGIGGKAFAPFDQNGQWIPELKIPDPPPATDSPPVLAPPPVPPSAGRPGGRPG